MTVGMYGLYCKGVDMYCIVTLCVGVYVTVCVCIVLC